jgi:secreted Zn-dependent insulinase-like peptidase
MHEFSDDEIDINDKSKLLENIETLKKEEIFDDNLYEHGFFYNSSLNQNILHIFFHLGNVDYKDLQFDIIEYFEYLFKSQYLFKILKEKDYILINLNNLNNLIGLYTYLILENNNIAILELVLTDKGLEEVENVLLIIYKYVEIMKKEGYKKEYFDNFIKYKQSQIITNFDKTNMFIDLSETFSLMIQNYKLYGENQILTTGTPTQKDYDENKLKKYLNNIKYEKSFFAVNTKYNTTNIPTFLESISGIKYPEMLVQFFDQFIALKHIIEDNGKIAVESQDNESIIFVATFSDSSVRDFALANTIPTVIIYGRPIAVQTDIVSDTQLRFILH